VIIEKPVAPAQVLHLVPIDGEQSLGQPLAGTSAPQTGHELDSSRSSRGYKMARGAPGLPGMAIRPP
jgi:hypothetical protein